MCLFFRIHPPKSALLNNHYNGNFTGGRAPTRAVGTPPPGAHGTRHPQGGGRAPLLAANPRGRLAGLPRVGARRRHASHVFMMFFHWLCPLQRAWRAPPRRMQGGKI